MTLALLLTAVGGAWAEDTKYNVTFKANGNTKTVENVTLPKTFKCEYYNENGELDLIIKELYGLKVGGFCHSDQAPSSSGSENVTCGLDGNDHFITISAPFDGTATVTGKYESYDDEQTFDYFLEITCTQAVDNTIKVTTDAAEEGALFTEASFEMPTYDVNFSYELVRDMSVQMTAKIGDGTDGYRIRLQKNEQTGKYEPAEMTVQQMMALVKVHDAIEDYDLTFGVLDANCIVNIYEANENNEATGNPIAFADLTPGRYIAKAVAATGSAYEGETALSNIFELYEGYEVVIPAGEYVTYYKDEAVRLDEKDKNDIELCTITAVEDGKAVLSDNFDAMKANTPFLLKNTTNETKTILLIPCTEPDLAVTVAKEFKGTEGACEFSEELMATGDFYVCNGIEFIKVRGAGTLAPNKAYLFVEGNSTPASIPFRRSIGGEGEGTTGLDASLVNSEEVNSVWYDLNGRKLNGKPAQKGIYIKNGKKVVVH